MDVPIGEQYSVQTVCPSEYLVSLETMPELFGKEYATLSTETLCIITQSRRKS